MCYICGKCVLQAVVVEYDPCRCVRRICQDCDAELEKSETDRCEIHSFSIRDTQRKGKKTRTTWPFNSLASVDYTELPFDAQYVYFAIFTRMWMWNITTLLSETMSKPRARFINHTVHRAATWQSQSSVFAVQGDLDCQMTMKWQLNWTCLCSIVCRWFWEKSVHGL